jgi:hypothetical protein
VAWDRNPVLHFPAGQPWTQRVLALTISFFICEMDLKTEAAIVAVLAVSGIENSTN